MKLAIYIHFPFCRRKCHYCDFVSTAGNSAAEMAAYLPLLLREMEQAARRLDAPVEACSLYFGGGTPSLLAPRQVERLIDRIAGLFGLAAGAEITLEANPGTVTGERLAAFRRAGVNRLSLGVQSFDDASLERLGRLHTARQAIAAFAAARRAGFADVGLDLIHGLPGQDLAMWHRELDRALALAPEHISAYGLSIEEGTPFAAQVATGELSLPDEETAAAIFEATAERLTAAGLEHYEIANFALPGHRSRHNQTYWRRGSYLGFGAGAHSFQRAPGFGVRWHNPPTVAAYGASLDLPRPPADAQLLGREEAMAEYLFLGLRLRDGIAEGEFLAEFGESVDAAYPGVVARLAGGGLLERRHGRLALSPRGLILANRVLAHFV